MLRKVKNEIEVFVTGFDYSFKEFICRGFDLCLVDVSSGSDTKVMARKIIDWSMNVS